MPKLYYTPTSCGAANFIAAYINKVNLETEVVTLNDHKTASGVDFYTINPKGNVPTIVTDEGNVLRENVATLSWIADQQPGTLAPAPGTPERYVFFDALATVNSEVHKAFGPLFNPTLSDEAKAAQKEVIAAKLKYVNDILLKDSDYLTGSQMTVADIYLYIILTWSEYLSVDYSSFAKVVAFFDRVKAREDIQAAHARINEAPATIA